MVPGGHSTVQKEDGVMAGSEGRRKEEGRKGM
jgi:hypothetical protein